MAEIVSVELPPFLEDEFARMVIPGNGDGFAISHTSGSKKRCVAFGRVDGGAVAVRSRGEEYTLEQRKLISSLVFEEVATMISSEFKKSGFIFAEDILDGEIYLLKWSNGHDLTRLVLGNPREIDEPLIRGFAIQLDKIMAYV